MRSSFAIMTLEQHDGVISSGTHRSKARNAHIPAEIKRFLLERSMHRSTP
jgi:hypothetical protein